MNGRQIFLALAATTAVTAHSDLEARAEPAGLETCARMLSMQIALARGAPVEYRISETTRARKGMRKKDGKWYLDARHPETGEVIARLDCAVDAHDGMLRLTEVPLTANDARARAAKD